MVGDGINDSVALTEADVGIAIGAGAAVAVDSASVVLKRSDPTDAVTAIKLGRRSLANIYENLFWALVYNLIGIPLAAGVFIPLLNMELSPMFGALVMSFSSLIVVTNANLLKKPRVSVWVTTTPMKKFIFRIKFLPLANSNI